VVRCLEPGRVPNDLQLRHRLLDWPFLSSQSPQERSFSRHSAHRIFAKHRASWPGRSDGTSTSCCHGVGAQRSAAPPATLPAPPPLSAARWEPGTDRPRRRGRSREGRPPSRSQARTTGSSSPAPHPRGPEPRFEWWPRLAVRMALGQLADYGRFASPMPPGPFSFPPARAQIWKSCSPRRALRVFGCPSDNGAGRFSQA
jgi:hypothetical protein